jgi:hypothetical protein
MSDSSLRSLGLLVALALGTQLGCSANEGSGLVGKSSGGTSAGTSGSGGTSAAQTASSPSTNGGAQGIDVSAGGSAGSTGEAVECTEGEDCNCPTLAVAVIGKAGKWGANTGKDSDTAFQDWLNSSSAGTAKVDNFTEKPTLTSEFLAPYNVVVLAALGDDSNVGPFWKFDAAEVAALQDWVEVQGGGVITLSGYAGDPGEIVPVNQLLTFSGISYNSDGISPDCAIVDATNNQYCWCGGSQPLAEFNRTDPFVSNLANSVTWVGIQNGRSINAPTDAVVAATVTPNGQTPKNVLVGKAVGKGRVLVYSDEWITYTSQWNGEGNPNSTNTACQGHLPQDVYQTAQFWYNMIKWTQPTFTCFKIVDKDQSVIIW